MRVPHDLTGQRFGILTAIEPTAQRKLGAVVWLCKCDCGAEVYESQRQLSTGHKHSCGCQITKDLTGQRFGRLTVVERAESSLKSTAARWLCNCDCGTVKTVRAYNLMSGETVGCGCVQRVRAAESSWKMRVGLYEDGTNISKAKATLAGREPIASNTSGVNGVSWAKGAWVANITFQGVRRSLGRYANIEDAKKARRDAELRIIGGYFEDKDK